MELKDALRRGGGVAWAVCRDGVLAQVTETETDYVVSRTTANGVTTWWRCSSCIGVLASFLGGEWRPGVAPQN